RRGALEPGELARRGGGAPDGAGGGVEVPGAPEQVHPVVVRRGDVGRELQQLRLVRREQRVPVPAGRGGERVGDLLGRGPDQRGRRGERRVAAGATGGEVGGELLVPDAGPPAHVDEVEH